MNILIFNSFDNHMKSFQLDIKTNLVVCKYHFVVSRAHTTMAEQSMSKKKQKEIIIKKDKK